MSTSRVTTTILSIVAIGAIVISITELAPVISCEQGELPAICAQRAQSLVK